MGGERAIRSTAFTPSLKDGMMSAVGHEERDTAVGYEEKARN